MACFTYQDLRDVYDYMKAAYIDKGAFRNDFEGLIKQVGKDLNRDPEEMAKVLASPKSIRNISDEMYRAYANRRRAKTQAQSWLMFKDAPALEKTFNALMQTTYATRVFGHGPVSFGVHAAPYMYMPTRWPQLMTDYLKAWGNLSDVQFEKMSRNIEQAGDFRFWNKHSKGSIDPAQHQDDMQAYADWAAQHYPKGTLPLRAFADLSRRGSQQFQGIKLFRLNMMRDYWDHLKDSQKTDAAADRIGDYVNHMTGVAPDVKLLQTVRGGAAGKFLFAPSLETARWMRLSDVQRTVRDLWNPDPGVRRFAYSRLRDYGEMAATYMGALALNNWWLHGSGNQINFNDRTKPDYLLFKRVNGDTIDPTGGERNTVRFILNEGLPQYDPKTGRRLTAGAAWAQRRETLGGYAFGKASPLAGTLMDVGFGSSYGEGGKQRPLPVPWAPPPSKGTTPYTVPEYLAERQAPIPVSAALASAIQDVKRGQPVSEAAEGAIVPFIVEGLFGARYQKK